MAGFTYSGLKTAIQNYLDNTETTFVNTLDTFIQTAEERILKSVQLPTFRKNVDGVVTTGNTYLTKPTDFLSPFSLALIDGNGNYSYLLLKHVSWIRDYTPLPTTTGEPLYYAQFDDDSFIIAPTPDVDYSVELHYNYRPNSLTTVGDDNQTWLSDNAPNAMLYGSLVEGAVFMKADPNTIGLYEQKYQESLAMLKLLGEFKDVRDEARNDQIKLMPQGTMNV
ncbi:MAG: hypothetical protein CBC57_02145 [Euryarchaeota archaeon TMED97]|nr:MAG: hypothetical protein CBC57_02145 [Euryarchaeota archaeon TMED97]|tara:strand:- start:14934 stop:15602 length:669 start_codon:yes stop_codon:yes gene_type:complete